MNWYEQSKNAFTAEDAEDSQRTQRFIFRARSA
jgi:hypothetical protein